MCGIAGFFDPAASPDEATRLQTMLSMIAYRGPDECTGRVGTGIGLGTVRLSIVDLVTGSQPAVSPNGQVAVVFNGEIFNYRELRESLIAKGVSFNTNSEVEVLLHLYLTHGPDMVRQLNGQFAIAVHDAAEGSFTLLRDPFGIRPLFWHVNKGRFLFGSEVKSIAAYPGVDLTIDKHALLQTMRFWTVVGSRTAFEGVHQVPPGHYLRWNAGEVHLQRYWEWPFSESVEPLRLGNDDEYFEAFSAALDASVQRQRMADVEVATYVSGGIDSSAITYQLATQAARSGLRGFSVAFGDPAYDESEAQRNLVDSLELAHTTATVNAEDIARVFPDVVRHAETPLFRTAPAPMFMLSQKVREAGIKVVMSGEGADEVLLGYDLFRETLIRRFWARQPESKHRPRLFQRLYDYLPQYKNRRYFNLLLDFYRPTLSNTDDRHYAMAVRWANGAALEVALHPETRAALGDYDPVDELNSWLPSAYDRADHIERAQCIEVGTLLANYLLSSQGDRMALAHSVETRYPYLDLEFVRFASSLPRRIKLRGLHDKYVLRNAYRGKIDDGIRNRPKFAYQAPEKKAFFQDTKPIDWVAETLSRKRLERHGLFDPDFVEKMCCNPPRESGRQSFRNNMIFTVILSTSLLADQFRDVVKQVTAVSKPTLKLMVPHDS